MFELQPDLGGTWLTSTYPGCQSDAPIHLYSYSFAPNYNFSKKFAPQSEILAYLQATAKTYNIYDKIRFRTRVSNVRWDESHNKWILHWINIDTEEEGIYEADVVFHATGVLRVPNIPKEFDAFKGDKWHSAKWNHSVDLTGKRVGVVDTTILLYQKMAWYSAFHRVVVYFVTWFYRFQQFPFNSELREKLTPKYELASRRIVLSDHFFSTLKMPHTSLHQSPITSINGNTIETSDGTKRELDVLILATGFDSSSNFPDGYWIGRGGIEIKKHWNGCPTVYCGIWVPHAPNFFLIWGPNSSTAHHAMTRVFEIQVMHAIRAISYMMEQNLVSMEIKQEVAEEFTNTIDQRMERSIFTTKMMPNLNFLLLANLSVQTMTIGFVIRAVLGTQGQEESAWQGSNQKRKSNNQFSYH
ncbi:hypothetical protein BGZ80_002219 [Entomortierella chlamydospora]|uniref:Flavin-containing monooxygenase n=1 Tax=Entomortierella chlamydospora TaxID=101097 RepID=A0A9P6SXG1_9FUNG|nr:hypothetical protein BGZ80_002219 [Entomortierella chlamydospora]